MVGNIDVQWPMANGIYASFQQEKRPGMSPAFPPIYPATKRLNLDQPQLKGNPHGLCPIPDAQLLIDVLGVIPHRASTQQQFLCDFRTMSRTGAASGLVWNGV